jgi:hypothetical protein
VFKKESKEEKEEKEKQKRGAEVSLLTTVISAEGPKELVKVAVVAPVQEVLVEEVQVGCSSG